MKLYLSSYRIPIPAMLFELVGKAPGDIRMALIPNAKDYKTLEEYELSMNDAIRAFKDLGLESKVIDLRRFSDDKTVYEALKDYDLIWGNGGNTFILRYEMRRSGFDRAIKRLLADGIVYGGESAGAIVMGASLEGIELADDPMLAPEIIYEGLGLVNVMIVPHADSPDPAFQERVPDILKMHGDKPYTVIPLNDDQVLVVDGDRQELRP